MTEQKNVAFVLSNKAVSSVTGWPIGFWLAELTHPYVEFVDAGFEVALFSPEGGALYMDDFSDPYADNGYSADDEANVGQKFQPFWIEEEAAKLADTTFVAGEPMASHAIRSGNLITGQQQHSGAEAARLVIEDLT